MTLRNPNDPIALRAVHRIGFTNGAERLGMAAGSTQQAYLVEGPRGNGFTMYLSLGHAQTFASTTDAETFITSALGGTIA